MCKRYYFRYKNDILATVKLVSNNIFSIEQLFVQPSAILYMLRDSNSFNKWISDRQGIFRPFAGDIFKLGDIRSDIDFVDVSLCLSLKDCFWLCSDINLKWEDINLFSHSFSEAYTKIASGLEGFRGTVIKTPSPEFSVLGSSCKFFKRQYDGIYLYKSFGGLAELEYSGVYSEYFVSQLLQFLDLDYVSYDIVKYDSRLFSKCKLFTSEYVNMIDIEDLVSDSIHLDEHIKHYSGVALKQFCDMLVVDALVFNVDRHCENIAMLFDNSLKIFRLAPIFDFDHSLFYDLSLINRSRDYISDGIRKYVPKTWANHTFIEQAKYCCYPELYFKLQKIKGNFEFTNHPKFPLNPERLNMINNVFRWNYKRIMGVLDNDF